MSFKPIQKLDVSRTLSNGEIVAVGALAQSRRGVFFQYDADYLDRFTNLAPFTLEANNQLQPAPKEPHAGLHGLFADSLPDGWGLLLQDRVFRQHGIMPAQVTAMDRLAFVGRRGIGALAFSPESEFQKVGNDHIDLALLGLEAQSLFDEAVDGDGDVDGEHHSEAVLAALIAVGSSGGARPKAQLFFSPERPDQCRILAQPGDEAWLVKFTSENLPLGHEESLCEATYLHLAELAQLQPPPWRLLDAPVTSGARAWLAVKRFDWVDNSGRSPDTPGRLHVLSACGLLDADFRTPSLDYVELIKASRQLCKSPAVGQLQFRRAIFNLFASNQDDHSKNWAFLQDDDGRWRPAPFYDVTFSPHPFNEHATAFEGHGKQPPLQAIQKLAASAGFANWRQAQKHVREIVDVVSQFPAIAQRYGIHKSTITAIEKILERRRRDNNALLG